MLDMTRVNFFPDLLLISLFFLAHFPTSLAFQGRPLAKSPWVGALYTGPFTELTLDYLKDVPDPSDQFGPEDKLVVCNNLLVFVDLESDTSTTYTYQYDIDANVWTKTTLVALPCPDSGQGGLLPRDTGTYTVGQTYGPSGDRLLIIGGAAASTAENNVYYSDDCGVTWKCYDGQQTWNSRIFSPVLHSPGIIPGDPVMMAGGITLVNQNPPQYLFSIAMFLSYDLGIHWQRPECESTSNCNYPLGTPDPVGIQCTAAYDSYKHCYTLPATPALPGALGADWDTYWLFYEAPANDPGGTGQVFSLASTNVQSGWVKQVGATDGGYGRKVFIRGTTPGTGCWFSTDYLAEDLWVFNDTRVQSTNTFATAASALGPWQVWPDVAPWAPRAAAALTTDYKGTAAYLASGMTFTNGQAGLPGFGDAWQIDAGVCLLAPSSSLVCNGKGSPDLGKVVCGCNDKWTGTFCETRGGVSPSPSTTPTLGPCASPTSGPNPPASPSSAAATPSTVNVPGAVFGTLGGLLALAGAIVLFAPTWSFAVGTRTVVPAELIKSGVAGVVGAVQGAGRALGGMLGGGVGGGEASSYRAVSGPSSSADPASFRASTLAGSGGIGKGEGTSLLGGAKGGPTGFA